MDGGYKYGDKHLVMYITDETFCSVETILDINYISNIYIKV